MSESPVAMRVAAPRDTTLIAQLHSESWRSAYRGILPDTYLDGEIYAERSALWQARFATPSDRQHVLIAEQARMPLGFGCILLDDEPAWGACLDNLHMRPEQKGRGVGRQLFAELTRWLIATAPTQPLYLLVFEANTAARGFYERYQGILAEQFDKTMPGGTHHPVARYVWRDTTALLNALTAESRRHHAHNRGNPA